ncbi:restriction endonuclease subunit S [Vibrio aestuarianus]|uniref:restriction endonuclease subunit S n=1 Tax=Vibrio aestuarianus TaxID=28171 RepID=UPI00237C9FC2|nr:restriction endonuclease subunit S [Vibrio aestuarianus]MDE1263078.1 restriction endonuclease subunit S [Vibrio aestuarianus]MDE1297251.1 restriction endonuclease subunit S [Vibrio aestuarianus]
MGSNFFSTTIGEQVTLQRGFDITKKEQQEGNVPVVSSGGISSYHNVSKVAAPGVVLGRKGTLGTVYFMDEDFWPHDTSLWVKDFKGNNPHYVYYFFKGMSAELKKMDVGAANPALNRNHVHLLKTEWPCREIQDKIVSIGAALDKKITLNNQTNQTLEAMAQAIFKSWFVDFDPVKAKMNGEQPTGMDIATASLFPDKLAESQVGLIPEGWSVNQLSDICKNHSQSYDLKSVDEVVFVNTGDVLEGDFLHKDYSPVVGLPGQAKKAIKEDDILYSEIRPKNKRFAYVDFDVSDYVVSTKFMVIQANEKVHPRLLYMMLTRQNTIDEFNVIADSRSGTFPQITFKAISNLEFCMAPRKVQDAFVAQVMPMIQLQRSLKTENKRLAELRDTLLPKLLSGEIELGNLQVEQAKALVE